MTEKEADQNPNAGVDPETLAHAARPVSPAQIEQWREEYDRENPAPPQPPIANVSLALELSAGFNTDRVYPFHGRGWRFGPTSYPTAIRLIAWGQRLEQLLALGKADPNLIADKLPELREACVELATLAAATLAVRLTGENPFLKADLPEYEPLVQFLLDPGDEVPIVPARAKAGDTLSRDNSAHSLYAYLAIFGAVPGMIVLADRRPQPASWRHFCQGMSYLKRARAEDALHLHGATAMASPYMKSEAIESWERMTRRSAGLAQ